MDTRNFLLFLVAGFSFINTSSQEKISKSISQQSILNHSEVSSDARMQQETLPMPFRQGRREPSPLLRPQVTELEGISPFK